MKNKEDAGVWVNVEKGVGVDAVIFVLEEDVKTGISTLDVGICRSSSLKTWLTYENFIYIVVF